MPLLPALRSSRPTVNRPMPNTIRMSFSDRFPRIYVSTVSFRILALNASAVFCSNHQFHLGKGDCRIPKLALTISACMVAGICSICLLNPDFCIRVLTSCRSAFPSSAKQRPEDNNISPAQMMLNNLTIFPCSLHPVRHFYSPSPENLLPHFSRSQIVILKVPQPLLRLTGT